MTSTTVLTLIRFVTTGTARRPDLARRLQSAAYMVRDDPPKNIGRDSRRWLCPSETRKNISWLVDRTAKTCQCPDHQAYRRARANGNGHKRIGAPDGFCKHRLAVEMYCRLNHEPDPPEEENAP